MSMTEEQAKKIKEIGEQQGFDEYQIKVLWILVQLLGADAVIQDMYNQYKLTRFEKDLLESECNKKFTFYNIPILMEMQRRGYYKNIPDNTPIEEILKNSICLE